MEKDFDAWSQLKQALHNRPSQADVHTRQVWWCSLGVNVGFEIDGKHKRFERPVLVLRVFNRETMLIAPLTSKSKDDRFHFSIIIADQKSWVSLTQIRTISHRRMIRRIGWLNKEQFLKVLQAIREFI